MSQIAAKSPTLIAAAVAAAATAAAGSLGAQESARDTTRLDPVVVTATRTPVERSAAPAAVTVLSGEELRAQGIMRVVDALRQVPGAAVAQSGGFGATSTLFLRGGERDYTKVLVDGVPVNDAGGDFDFGSLTTDNVDRIEVLRGPGSVIYGSDAVTGVIQIFTRRGAGRPSATLDARGGSYGTYEASTDLSGRSGALGWSAGAARRRADGVLAFNNEYRNDALSALLRLTPAAGADVQLSTRYTGATYHFPTDFAGAVTDSNQYTRERRLTAGLDAGYRVARRLEARLLLADSRGSRVSDNAPDSPGDTTDFYSRDDADRYRRSADVRVNAFLPASSVATVGGAYEGEGETSRGTSAFGTLTLDPTVFHERRINRAVYTQIFSRPHERATLSLGGRYDANGSFGIFRTGRAALSLMLPFAIRARAAAGNAFKEPAFSEVFNTAFTTGNRSLRPERTRSYEGALERAFLGGAFSLVATYFSQRFDDLVQYRPGDPSDVAGLPNYFNVAAAKAAGIEAEVRTARLFGIAAAAQYSYVDTRVLEAGFGASGTFVTGDGLLRRPNRTASATLDYSAPRRGSLALTLHHVGRRSDRDFTVSPARAVSLSAYTTLDVGASLAIPLARTAPRLALTARVENAFAKRYQSVFGYDAPRRVVLVGGRITLGQ